MESNVVADNKVGDIEFFQTRLSSFPLSVQHNASKGRYITSSRNIKKDELVFRGLPYCFALSDSHKKRACDWCLKFDHQGRTFHHACTNCKQVWYCSEQCKTESSVHHEKRLCAAFRKTLSSKNSLGKHSLSILKILLKVLDRKLSEIESSTAKFYALTEHKVESTETAENTKLCTDQVVSTSLECTPQQELHWVQEYGTSYHDVERLISNRHLWDEDEVKDWKKTIHTVCKLFASDSLGLTDDMLLHLISRIECNNFGLWANNHQISYGRALYPLASLFNHSCAPNCNVEINGVWLSVYANVDVADGDELCIRYIDCNFPRSSRQAKLLSEYKFHCHCVRCANEEDKSEKMSYQKEKKVKVASKKAVKSKEPVTPVDQLQERVQQFKLTSALYKASQ